jgi:hypothetical protein
MVLLKTTLSKNSVESEFVNTLHEINLTTIDTDGSVRMEFAAVEV